MAVVAGDTVRAKYNSLLENISNELDISPSKYNQAVSRYKAVGAALEKGDYGPGEVKLEVYPQGSFRLGTVVRPLREGKEAGYDIDLVSELQIGKHQTNPREVKNWIGDTLKGNGTYARMLEDESQRCWTLEYTEEDGIDFHLDILPSIPEDINTKKSLVATGVESSIADQAIAITHKIGHYLYEWSSSNPNGYADWFYRKIEPAFFAVESRQRNLLFESHRDVYANVADVPKPLIKTPLQRAIQILKRHRDRRFAGHEWENEKPISIIITTLGAQIYRQEGDVITALENIINILSQHSGLFDPAFKLNESLASIRMIRREVDGKWHIPNPVNPGENFADMWHLDGDRRAKAFFNWVNWAKQDLTEILSQYQNINSLGQKIEESFGSEIVSRATNKNGIFPVSVPAVGASHPLSRFNVDHRQPPQWPVHISAKVTITGTFSVKGLRPQEFSSDCRPLPKSASLRFEASTSVSWPYKVFWQVVNTGSEASNARCLRGGFYEGIIEKGGRVRKESTLYTGMHWIECFIVKGGVCVARSREFVVNIQ